MVDYAPELMAEDQCGTGRVYRFAEHELPDTTLAGSNDFAEVHSQSPLTPDDLAAVLAKAEATYREAQKRQGQSADGVDGGPITVYVLDDEGFIEYSDDASGAIADQDEQGNYLVTSRSQALGSVEDPLFVHESVHLNDAGDDVTRLESAGVPYYLLEGKALAIEVGYATESAEGVREYDWEMANAAAELTGDEAAMQMKYAREAEATQTSACFNQVYEAGGLFVEYLRTGFNGGEPNAVSLIAEAIAMVHQGSSFADAFKAKFGATLEGAEEGFVQHVRDTEGQPLERLKDTVFEKPYLSPPVTDDANAVLAAWEEDGKDATYADAYRWYDQAYWELDERIAADVEAWVAAGRPADVAVISEDTSAHITGLADGNAGLLELLLETAGALQNELVTQAG